MKEVKAKREQQNISEMQPLVSIVTPSYNQGEFIEDTILSVKNQDYANIEHIIVDGDSTDNTLEVLKKYEGTYKMRWTSEPDEGMYEAINRGLHESQGEILAYLNTDDLYLPWTVKVVVRFFQQDPGVEVCYGNMINTNLETGRNRLFFYPKFDLQFLIRRGSLGQPTVFFRRSVLNKVGFLDEELKFVADCEYWMRAGRQCKISKIEQVLAIERDHPATQRERYSPQLREELRNVRARYGKANSLRGKLTIVSDYLKLFWVYRVSMAGFILHYVRRSSSNVELDTVPCSELIKHNNFVVISCPRFLIDMIPWINMRYSKNWFMLSSERHPNEAKTMGEKEYGRGK